MARNAIHEAAIDEAVVADIAALYCENYAPDELPLLELNKGKLMGFAAKPNAPSPNYTDALGAGGVEDELLLPIVIYVLGTIVKVIVADTYNTAKAKFVAYICDSDNNIEALFGTNGRAKRVIAQLREIMCRENK